MEYRHRPCIKTGESTDLVPTHKHDIILDNGAPEIKYDLVILGDGYTKSEMDKFVKDVKRLTGALLATEPFKSHMKDINIRAVETPSEISGVNKPHPGVQTFSIVGKLRHI